MRSLVLVLAFIALTFLTWGIYGPVLHEGQNAMDHDSFRPFICVGLAYFAIAVVVPLIFLKLYGEKGSWTMNGTIWSLAAGAAGAVGALGIIMAFKFRGNPVYVMPLVFGCAPVVNTLVTMYMTKTFKQAGVLFIAGVVTVAIGAAGVMVFKPSGHKSDLEVTIKGSEEGPLTVATKDKKSGGTTSITADDAKDLKKKDAKAYALYNKHKPFEFINFLMIPISIAITAVCWGCYGPVLHKGQMKMGGSRLRPLLCVGLAYFLIAVLVPSAILAAEFPKLWTVSGATWSLAAGAAGAVGALGIIMAFNFGGRPIFVMPLVFGGAPVINTFTTIFTQGLIGDIGGAFIGSLALVICGAVTVLIFAPKPAPKKPGGEKGKPDKKSSHSMEDIAAGKVVDEPTKADTETASNE